jgi:hypothetical protein
MTLMPRIATALLMGCVASIVLFLPGTSTGQKKGGQAKSIARPSAAKELAGVYIGYTEDNLQFYRLELRDDFTGYCATVSAPDTVLHNYGVHAYRITSWTTKRWELVLTIEPLKERVFNKEIDNIVYRNLGETAEPIYMKGRVRGGKLLDLEVGEVNSDWHQRLQLQSESRLKAPNEETKLRIEELEKK